MEKDERAALIPLPLPDMSSVEGFMAVLDWCHRQIEKYPGYFTASAKQIGLNHPKPDNEQGPPRPIRY